MLQRSLMVRILLLALAAHVGVAHATDLPPAEFSIREPVARTGSNIRKDVVWYSSIPLNRTYAQLTAKEKAVVHSMYERIEEGDEPPFPLEGLRPILMAIWQGSSRRQVSGTLTLAATVDSQGTVTEVVAYDDPDPVFTKFAASVLMMTKFKPAICKGVPCRMQYPFSFKLTVR